VRLGDGAGGFGAEQEFTAPGSYPDSISIADLNNDTKPDMVVAGINQLSTFIGNGNGTFQPGVSTYVGDFAQVAIGHFNNDNKIDLVVGTYNWESPGLFYQAYLGDGLGGFTAVGWYAEQIPGPGGLAAVELNNDGKLDVVVGNGLVLLGNGNGTFQYNLSQPLPLGGGATATGDFTGDGRTDVLVAGNGVAVLRNRGDGTLDTPIHSFANAGYSAVATADFNADGKLDTIMTQGSKGTASVLLGHGDGTFRFAGAFAVGTTPTSVTAGDFNRDGRPDAAIANRDSKDLSVLFNDGNWATLPPPPSTLAISDTTVTEGDSGTLNATLAVSLSYPSAFDVTVQYTTWNGYATQIDDYIFTSGTLSIPAGQTSRTFTVPIKGDLIAEPTETFFVDLTNATGAPIVDAQGICTILDNDVPPAIAISDVSRAEGNSGTTPFTFTVSLTSGSGQDVQVNYTTAGGSATSSGGTRDYQSKSGTLNFPAGITSQTVAVFVVGDSRNESDETFFVNLGQPVNAPIADSQGVGTILNDDGGRGKSWVGPASGGSWSTASNWSPSGVPGADSLVAIDGASVELLTSASVSELSLRSDAALAVTAGGDGVLRTTSLFLDPDSVLNLSDNELIIDYTGDSPAPAIRELLRSGRNGGAWNGYGLNTSSAVEGVTGLGYAESADLFSSFPASLGAQSVDATSILVRHTLLGDANLDGGVAVSDLGILATNWQQSPRSFAQGDFDYDGTVDVNDLGILATSWQKNLPQSSAPRSVLGSAFNARRRATARMFDEMVGSLRERDPSRNPEPLPGKHSTHS
jgi:Calx-beta domain/FG-GAP-like repeat